ncbi:MAG: N-acetylneuraminate synthase family protein [Gemmatimonadaceae bacterium]
MHTRTPTFIIAEMAWSHNGSVDHALAMVQGAKAAGANAIGIHLTSLPDYMVRAYQGSAGKAVSDKGTAPGTAIYDYLSRIDLKEADWTIVIAAARQAGLELVTMCNDEPSIDLAERLAGVDHYVIAAACFTEYTLVRRLARKGKPLILRIGGATVAEIDEVLRIAREEGAHRITLLHGIQLYPTPIELLNLSALPALSERFACPVGLADHIDGSLPEAITLPALAIPYGPTMVEKHITVHRDLLLEDYEAALGIEEFGRFVAHLRLAEAAVGTGEIGAESEADQRYRNVSRKRVVARRTISAGAIISNDDLAFKRSDSGIEVGRAESLLGMRAARTLRADDGIELADCERP